MTLPLLMLVADGFATGRRGRDAEQIHETVCAAVRAGLRWVQLRDHHADPERFASCARQLAGRISEHGSDVLVSINTIADVARDLDAGLHIGNRGPSAREARAALGDRPLTVSIHGPDEVGAALEAGAEALVFSPVFPTESKPGHPGAGTEALAAICQLAGSTPVYALGGVRPERVRACLAAGAHGVAVLSTIVDARPAAVPVVVSAFFHALDSEIS